MIVAPETLQLKSYMKKLPCFNVYNPCKIKKRMQKGYLHGIRRNKLIRQKGLWSLALTVSSHKHSHIKELQMKYCHHCKVTHHFASATLWLAVAGVSVWQCMHLYSYTTKGIRACLWAHLGGCLTACECENTSLHKDIHVPPHIPCSSLPPSQWRAAYAVPGLSRTGSVVTTCIFPTSSHHLLLSSLQTRSPLPINNCSRTPKGLLYTCL